MGDNSRRTMQLMQQRAPIRAASRARTVRVQAKVQKAEGAPRVVRGKCFVTKDVRISLHMALLYTDYGPVIKLFLRLQNIDTDQIIPAEYLTLVPSKVRKSAAACGSACYQRGKLPELNRKHPAHLCIQQSSPSSSTQQQWHQ